MIDSSYVVFKIKVDQEKVKKEWEEFITKPEQDTLLDENTRIVLQSLMCSEYIFVPEQQLSRFIKYGEVIK